MIAGSTRPLIPVCFILSALLIAGPFFGHERAARHHDHEYDEVRKLGAMLGTAQRAHTAATTAADSARLAPEIKDRKYFLGQRAYHLSYQRMGLDTYWELGRAPTNSIGIGIVLLAAAIFMKRRNAAAPATGNTSQG